MKQVEAIIRPFQLGEVQEALTKLMGRHAPFPAMVAYDRWFAIARFTER